MDSFLTRERNVHELQPSSMPRLHPDSSLSELQEVLKASQDEVNRRGLQPLILCMHLLQQAGVCGWVRDGFFNGVLYLKGKKARRIV